MSLRMQVLSDTKILHPNKEFVLKNLTHFFMGSNLSSIFEAIDLIVITNGDFSNVLSIGFELLQSIHGAN